MSVQYRCPKCKDEGPFEVYGQGWCGLNLRVDSDGCVEDYDVDEVRDYEFDGDSSAYCRNCGFHDGWYHFDVDNQEDEDEEEDGSGRDGIEFEDEKVGDAAEADELMDYIEGRLESERRG